MSHWKKDRNYRSFQQENGDTAFFITIHGRAYPVTAEVYEAYSQADRRERYLTELESAETILSIEKMADDEVCLEKYMTAHAESAEDVLLAQEETAELAELLKAVGVALLSLADDERKFIQAIFFDGLSLREMARRKGVTLEAVRKQRDRILKKLKNFL